MSCDAFFKIIYMFGVIRTIGASQNVNPETHYSVWFLIPCERKLPLGPFDKLRANGAIIPSISGYPFVLSLVEAFLTLNP